MYEFSTLLGGERPAFAAAPVVFYGAAMALLQAAVNETGLSARAHDKIIRVARTIADLEGSESIEMPHIHEAINYRMLDRNLWM